MQESKAQHALLKKTRTVLSTERRLSGASELSSRHPSCELESYLSCNLLLHRHQPCLKHIALTSLQCGARLGWAVLTATTGPEKQFESVYVLRAGTEKRCVSAVDTSKRLDTIAEGISDNGSQTTLFSKQGWAWLPSKTLASLSHAHACTETCLLPCRLQCVCRLLRAVYAGRHAEPVWAHACPCVSARVRKDPRRAHNGARDLTPKKRCHRDRLF